MSIAKNIKEIRDRFNLTQDELGEIAGVSGGAVSTWERGTAEPRMGAVQKIADKLKISKADIIEDRNPIKTVRAIRIPVLGRVQAGIPIDAQEEIVDWEEITPDMGITGEFFGLRINGDSMQPRIVEGDVVIVRQQSDAESGDVVIALVNGNEATIKKLIKYENGGIALVAFNPLYEPLQYSEGDIASLPVQIIGKVVELRAKF